MPGASSFFTPFFKTLPPELEDAAIIDGCSLFGVWWRVMMPMSTPGLLTVSLFSFLGHWNEYFWALIILWDDAKRTLPVGMAELLAVQTYRIDYGPLFAGFVIMAHPHSDRLRHLPEQADAGHHHRRVEGITSVAGGQYLFAATGASPTTGR